MERYEISHRDGDSSTTTTVYAKDKDWAVWKLTSRGKIKKDDVIQIQQWVNPNPPKPLTQKSKMDELEAFVKFPQFYPFLKKYDAGSEQALAKQIPLTADNVAIIDAMAKVIPIIRRYRGPRLRGGYMRECHKQDAERVSIYAR